jgi:hypothetical protein
MPYSNVPKALTGKMDRCVQSVMKGGKTKQQAIAICHKSIVGGGIEKAANEKLKGGKK